MHSSRMRTARSSSCRGGGSPPGTPWDQTPTDQAHSPPGTRPLWTRHPSQTRPPLGPPPPGPGTPTPLEPGIPQHQAPPVDRYTPVNILPCPKVRLRAVITCKTFLRENFLANTNPNLRPRQSLLSGLISQKEGYGGFWFGLNSLKQWQTYQWINRTKPVSSVKYHTMEHKRLP